MKKENNNELENLYKKAAEHFPLNTNSADWQTVLNQLENDDAKKAFWLNKKTILLALLLIIFSVSSFFLVSTLLHNNSINKDSNIVEQNKVSDVNTQTKNLEEQITKSVYKKIMDSLKKEKIVENKNQLLNEKEIVLNSTYYPITIINSDFEAKKINAQRYNFLNKKNISSRLNKNEGNLYTVPIHLKRSSIKVNQSEAFEEKESSRIQIIPNKILDSTITKTPSKIDSVTKTTSVPLPINKDKNKKYFYAGILYATDISSLHFENHKADDDGFSLSFLVGYRLNNYLSLESGISFQNKEYYTLGNHFNKSILPASGNILWIEAENKLIEIPLSLKIDLLNKKQHNLFANIGISSYIVNKEAYEYEQETAGVITKESVEYKATSSNFLATLNFGLGYQYSFKKWGSIRLQPYFNIPLKGIGKGSEPVVSKGIYVGWIYNFKH